MHVSTRKLPATDSRPTRISVSDGQGTRATYPWFHELDTQENHVWAAATYAREQKGQPHVVAHEIHRRPSADGYIITLTPYTPEA